MKIHNFCAGPSILPIEVFEEASNAVKDLNGSGLSLLEISHRSHAFVEIMDEARDLSLELLGLSGNDYTALFLQGGASSQFLMVAYNYLRNEAAYLNTGTWSKKAIKEAKLYGKVDVIASSENENFNYIPKYDISKQYDYFHCTSNNTIFGTQINFFPSTKTPIFCDMSSDIFSRVLDFSKFDLIYAGAQKNLGPAGATLVVIKNDLLDNIKDTSGKIISLDEKGVEKRITELQESGFFSDKFIEGYSEHIQEINEGFQNGQIVWEDGSQPSFLDMGDPWCHCQDYPENFCRHLGAAESPQYAL